MKQASAGEKRNNDLLARGRSRKRGEDKVPRAKARDRAPDASAAQRGSGPEGRPLDPGTREFMEDRFGHDFSRVRLHTEPPAARSAREMGARAYSVGSHVVVADPPATPRSRKVLAHELAHVVQHERRGPGTPASSRSLVSSPTSAAEREATAAAGAVALGRPVTVKERPAGLVQRDVGETVAAGTFTGAVAGAAIGGIAGGPIGMLIGAGIGAVVGLIGGLIAGLRRRTTPVTPTEGDQLIRDRFGDNLAAAIAAGTQVEGNIQVVDDAAYRVAYEALYGSIDEDYPNVVAFVDRSTDPPTVWIHEERQTPATVIHEGLHLYSDPAMRTQLGTNINEGVTEYLTRLIIEEQRLERHSGIYDDEQAEIAALVEVVGEDVLRRAYFEGDLDGLRDALDDAREAGTWASWVGHMQAGDWEDARAAIAP